ncbi:hypothetical protein E2C01_097484 [Portunus trituberculatus]|uniref:Uncharacterized protein n=1 Tax=Portunus trituberculatus TaxID=210409 RepID=A0A5B7K5U4_PORTR|nr:hypothetical protein [Portunus trituberculatus]
MQHTQHPTERNPPHISSSSVHTTRLHSNPSHLGSSTRVTCFTDAMRASPINVHHNINADAD